MDLAELMFKKIFKTAFISSAVIAASSASANSWFVGGTLGLSKSDLTTSINGEAPSESAGSILAGTSDLRMSTSLVTTGRLGYFINDNFRVYANLTDFGESTEKGSWTSHGLKEITIGQKELSLSADYVNNLFNLSHTRYFVGGTLGVNRLEAKAKRTISNVTSEKSGTSNAVMYGLQAGVIHNFNERFSIEGGYRYSFLNNEVKLGFSDGDMKFKAKNQQTIYLGMSYHF